jgi:hypothetical protein
MKFLSALLVAMLYVFVCVTCGGTMLRNMTGNLRGSDTGAENRITNYTNAMSDIEGPSNAPCGTDESVTNFDYINLSVPMVDISSNLDISDDILPSEFNLRDYMKERNQNVIQRHLRIVYQIANADIIMV